MARKHVVCEIEEIKSIHEALEDLVNGADSCGCSYDLTVVNKSDLERLARLIESLIKEKEIK